MNDQHDSNFDVRASGWIGFLASFAVHVGFLIVLASWVLTAGGKSHGVMFVAELGDSRLTSLESLASFELTPEQPMEELPNVDNQVDIDVKVELPTATEQPATALSSTAGSYAASASERLAAPAKDRGALFFGSYAEGNRFVYVLDSSRSMREDDRWTYACNQLIDSIQALRPEQEFFVICFDAKTSLMFNTVRSRIKYFSSEESIVPKVRRWLRGRRLGEATMPAEALQIALSLNPDAIFLLSDGELQDESIDMLRQNNGFSSSYRQIPIHTIHLFSQSGRQTLQLLARENGGTFTPVEK